MKYIKEYNFWDNYGKKWKVPLKEPDFFICLHNAGINDEELKRWKHLYNMNIFHKTNSIEKKPKYIILNKWASGHFTWSELETYSLQDNANFKYMGELEATPNEIKQWYEDIEMKKDMEKYNL